MHRRLEFAVCLVTAASFFVVHIDAYDLQTYLKMIGAYVKMHLVENSISGAC
jgi:hypothetical protein